MSKAVDDILAFLRSEFLSDEQQAELIQRLRDGEGDEHKPAGTWIMHGPNGGLWHAEDPGLDIAWIHGPDVDPDDGLQIVFYHGRDDGKPVIQIDGSADFRINVNDCPVWDQSTSEPYSMPEELESDMVAKPQEQRLVWVGTIRDMNGVWVYVGATEEALYQDMRFNYGEIEFRDESNYEWSKRVRDIAELSVDSYYVEQEEEG